MAKIKLGALAGEVSGSIGCYTFSHNRGGPYVRLRNIPDKYTTPAALKAKSRLATVSGNWRVLDAAHREAWKSYASANPVMDSLGERRPLSGAQAYMALANRYFMMTNALLSLPPGVPPPDALRTLSFTAVAITPAAVCTFTTTPLPTNMVLFAYGCYVDSVSKLFVKKDLRYIDNSSTAQATGWDIGPQTVARLGSMVPGQYLVLSIAVADSTTGLMSMPLQARQIIS